MILMMIWLLGFGLLDSVQQGCFGSNEVSVPNVSDNLPHAFCDCIDTSYVAVDIYVAWSERGYSFYIIFEFRE